MKELETRIIQDGKIINNEILKIDSFINHQIDVNLLNNISKYLASHFANITKILTIETSGIAFAIGVSQCLGNIPVVFAKKTKSKIELLFSYSEWWRYIGSVKPRQPPADWSAWEGASLSEIFEQ